MLRRCLAIMSSSSLSNFLSTQKTTYLKDVARNDFQHWTLVMGNESGDTDSISSSIAYAWSLSCIHQRPSIPLIRIKRSDLHLRPENLYSLSSAGFSQQLSELLCMDDLPKSAPFPAIKFAIVDHNRLHPAFLTNNPSARVEAVIDHHADEGLYKATANPRLIVDARSCASLVSRHIGPTPLLPPTLATLLLSAIVLDSGGLKNATPVDLEAVTSLLPRSTLASATTAATTTSQTDPLFRLTAELHTRKVSLDGLSTFDHLRRDYKEYALTLSATRAGSHVLRAGLSTIPQPLHQCVDLLPAVRTWMARRRLHISCAVTSFFTKEGKHKREQAWVVRRDLADEGGDEDVDVGVDGGTLSVDLDELASTLWKGLEASPELGAKPHPKFDLKGAGAGERVKVYVQRSGVTRKFTAPLMKRIIEGHRWAASDTPTPQ